MTEHTQVSDRDLEQLSAYLDGRLEPREAARLEARLKQDQSLRVELQELRATMQALSSLPQIRAPRNFSLQLRAVAPRGGYPLLQLGTALATLSFLVVVGADLLLDRGGAASLRTDAEFAAPAALPEAAAEAPALDQPRALAPEATSEAAPGAASDSDKLAQAAAESAVATPTEQPETLKNRAGAGTATEPAAAEPTAAVTSAAGDNGGTTSAPEPARNAELQAGEEQVGEALAEQPGETESQELSALEQASQPVSPFLRAAEIGLGSTAIILGVLTLRARRRG